MLLSELKSQIASIENAARRNAFERLALYVSSGDVVRPEFAPSLENASTYRAFFDALYADDGLRFTTVWAEWARLSHKKWLERFAPEIFVPNIRLKGDGLPIEMGTGIVLAPTGSRDNIVDFHVFSSGGFNTEAATYVTSIGGSFTCAGYDFVGVYGVYHSLGSVILEAWEE